MARRLFTASMLGLLAVMIFAMPALAGETWCAKDPIVRLNGEDVQIWVAIPEEYETLVTGPVEVKVATGPKVSRELIYLDAGFNGYGENVKFAQLSGGKLYRDGSFDVMISAWVPIDKAGLKAMGERSQTIPFRIIVETNGDTVTYENGTMDVVNGQEFMVEQTNDKTQINFVVRPGN